MFYEDNDIKIYNQDCRQMAQLPEESIQCVVTSPPYWGLRKYSGEQELIWGGDKDCEHQWDKLPSSFKKSNQGVGSNTMAISPKLEELNAQRDSGSNTCSLCGAWKGAYGLEPTPEMYVQHTIEILREIRRVLHKDGVVFWNIGDSYWGSGGEHYKGTGFTPEALRKSGREAAKATERQGKHNSLKPKDLCLIPFRVAIAAQEDGWWVRSVIIWSKPNPMPESVTDRPTQSHEYILMLTKSAKYYWDADAVREPLQECSINRANYGWYGTKLIDGNYKGLAPIDKMGDRFAPPSGRNIRSVWEFPTQPYPEAHFAVFPEKLPELCIKAATPEVGCCSKCGSPWERITKPSEEYAKHLGGKGFGDKGWIEKGGGYQKHKNYPSLTAQYETLGWQPTCKCNADKVLSIVLDPFMGAGTTLWIAKILNRQAIGYEISEEYCQLAVDRCRQQVLK